MSLLCPSEKFFKTLELKSYAVSYFESFKAGFWRNPWIRLEKKKKRATIVMGKIFFFMLRKFYYKRPVCER